MAEHQAPCIHPVSLPSIHEMFPAHLLRPDNEYNSRHRAPDNHRSQSSRSPVPHPRALPPSRPYAHHPEAAARLQSRDPRSLDLLHESDPRDQRKRSAYSFDVLRSDPMNSSLQHLTSSGNHHPSNPQQHLTPNAITSGSPAFRVSVPPTTAANATYMYNPASIEGHSRAPQSIASDPVSDDDNPGESAGKKHICPTCLKRFNRPSSLRIHVNTHTGATPFRCPWPNCGREFNVNSNMRRHYRNHTTPGFSRAQPNDNRRKRRRVDGLDALSHPTTAVDQAYRRSLPTNLMPSPPISHFSPSDSDYDSEEMEGECHSIQECDELVDYNTKQPPAYRSIPNLSQSMARVTVTPAKPQHESSPYGASLRYPQRQNTYGDAPTVRPLTPGSSSGFHSSSPSNSPSPRLQPASTLPRNGPHSYPHIHATKREHKYNPSAPYVHSLADTRVSTALRPAFHS